MDQPPHCRPPDQQMGGPCYTCWAKAAVEVSTRCWGEGSEGHAGFYRQRGAGSLGSTPASLVARQGAHSWLRRAASSKGHQGKSHHYGPR